MKFMFRHAAPLAGAWLMLSPAVLAAEEKAAMEPELAAPFAQYQNFRDEPVRDWRQANDRVNEVGGWRTYLREAQQDGARGGHDQHGH